MLYASRNDVKARGYLPDSDLADCSARQASAPHLFLGAFIPPSDPNERHTRQLVGFTCGTGTCSDHFTLQSMSEHDSSGRNVAIHSLVVSQAFKGHRLGQALLLELKRRLFEDDQYDRIVLACHEELRFWYARAGFTNDGPSDLKVC